MAKVSFNLIDFLQSLDRIIRAAQSIKNNVLGTRFQAEQQGMMPGYPITTADQFALTNPYGGLQPKQTSTHQPETYEIALNRSLSQSRKVQSLLQNKLQAVAVYVRPIEEHTNLIAIHAEKQ